MSVKGEERLDGDLLFGLLLWSQISLYSLNLSQTKQQNIPLTTVPLIGLLGALKIHHEEEGRSCTDSDCLWWMTFGHVDGGPDGSSKDGQGGVQEIHFDRDIVRWRAILVAHLDLHKRHKTYVI